MINGFNGLENILFVFKNRRPTKNATRNVAFAGCGCGAAQQMWLLGGSGFAVEGVVRRATAAGTVTGRGRDAEMPAGPARPTNRRDSRLRLPGQVGPGPGSPWRQGRSNGHAGGGTV